MVTKSSALRAAFQHKVPTPIPGRIAFASLLKSTDADKAQPLLETSQLDSGQGTRESLLPTCPTRVGEDATVASRSPLRDEPSESPRTTLEIAAKPNIETVFEATVSRIAWGGTNAAPLVHMTLAQGSLAGTELLVERNAYGIRVRFSGLSLADRERYRGAIERRLNDASLLIDEIDVE